MAAISKETASPEATVNVNVEKWGRALIDAGWTLVPSTLIERQRKLGLDAVDFNILMHLLSYWWDAKNKPHPSKKRIADALGVHPRTVQRRIAAMEKSGLIKREERTGAGKGTQTNKYDLKGLIAAATPLAKELLEERAEKRKRTRKMGPLQLVK